MAQLADLFSLPEMNLLCNVTQYLHQNAIDYHPESLFRDVKVATAYNFSFYNIEPINQMLPFKLYIVGISSKYSSCDASDSWKKSGAVFGI